MKIENARVVGFNHVADLDRSSRNNPIYETRYGWVELTLAVPVAVSDLPNFLAERRVTLEIEGTPGESAYLEHVRTSPFSVPATMRWEALSPRERERWEGIAREARKAHK